MILFLLLTVWFIWYLILCFFVKYTPKIEIPPEEFADSMDWLRLMAGI